MSRPTALILRTAGTNCDRELAHAFELAGATPRTIHLSALIADPARLEEGQLIGLPGGFSYGDDISAGRIFANRLRHRLFEPLRAAIDRATPMIGVCNGFQVLVKMGLLPFPDDHDGDDADTGKDGEAAPGHAQHRPARQVATLADNPDGRFVDQWTPLQADPASVCVWTRGLDAFELPIANGEGRLLTADPAVLDRIRRNGQVALRYAAGRNPNGSMDDIAGLCDPSGLVLGMMPHPERFTDPTHHPTWTRLGETFFSRTPAGLRFFENAVAHVHRTQAARV